ncbi:globin CTT-X-like [Chironomus tepperi]|uniref:globin CTT-X-like n=1 Tax=Chironomus tepperi TaxID=113505 RepID=UPI00391FB3F7
MSVVTPALKCLTNRQIELIKCNWQALSENPEESGQAIFYTFLLRHPEHKQRYAAFRNISLENLKDTAQIKRHCMKIMTVFGTVIDALGTENCKSIIYDAIADNADFHGKKGIEKEHFNQIRDILVEVVTGACSLDDEGQEAWNDLMDTMYHITFNVLDELRK